MSGLAPSKEKLLRLAHVARRYYLEDWKQIDIARELGVSRPLVSRMAGGARELGVVQITVYERGKRALSCWTGCGCPPPPGGRAGGGRPGRRRHQSAALPGGRGPAAADRRPPALGVGWGHLIGQLVTWLEENPQPSSTVTDIFPLVGNASIPARNYQSNENVRLMAQQLGAAPHFLYLPALPESLEEKQLLCSTEVYRQIQDQWVQMDTALVNIGNYPSQP